MVAESMFCAATSVSMAPASTGRMALSERMNEKMLTKEGVVLVEDEQGAASGVGYMELTGYQ